jgi:hypothetical protein
VLIGGGRHFTDYSALRATLDALLAHHLLDVELLTQGGPGVALLAASSATERGLKVAALVPELRRFPVDAVDQRDAFLVGAADAAVVVWDGCDLNVQRVLALVERRGLPVHVVGGPPRVKARKVRDPEPLAPRGLPDS